MLRRSLHVNLIGLPMQPGTSLLTHTIVKIINYWA